MFRPPCVPDGYPGGYGSYPERQGRTMQEQAYTGFREAQIGQTLERPVLVTVIAENTAKNGKTFVRVTMKDGASEITAAMFDVSAAELADRGIRKNMIADVRLTVSEYQGARSFKIAEIRPTQDTSLGVGDFTKLPPVELDVMYEEICTLIGSAADDRGGSCTPLSDLALRILEDHKKSYMTSSAAVSMHHNLRGGLLYHSYRMVKAADALCRVYDGLDRELMLCGAALHDIGKIWEYRTSVTGEAEITPGSVLLGHLYMGAALIKGYTAGKDYHREKVQLLIHMILSHHGTREWGAVVCPATPEAFVLHYIDNIDAKLYMCEAFYEELAPGSFTEKKPFGLDNRVYRPDLGEV